MHYQSDIITEVCVDSYDTAVAAAKSGATRIELCASLAEGGLTPPYSLMQKVCHDVNLPVHIMIRPRSGDFLYNHNEFELMKADVANAISAKAAGVVFGILNADGSVDILKCRTLIELAKPLKVTFHRAFDMTVDPFLSLEEIITLGVNNLLTSGQRQVAEDGLEMIRELVKRANNRLTVMAGGGVNSGNVLLLGEAGVKAFHFTCRKKSPGGMHYRNEALQSMGSSTSAEEYDIFEFDKQKMESIQRALKIVK